MKNALIHLEADKVTISEQGKAAARKWKAGDKPFVQFLAESEANQWADKASEIDQDYKRIDPVGATQEDGENKWYTPSKGEVIVKESDDRISLDIGSRLEIQSSPKLKGFIVRSTTRVNLGEDSNSCETHWEVFPTDT
jgi:hypothetical protein